MNSLQYELKNWEEYRFGFQGQEKDDEVKGNGNSLDFGARIYDPRLGRWFAVDKLFAKHPFISPYTFVADNPIVHVDYDGNDYEVVIAKSSTGNTITIKATYYTEVKGTDSYNEALAATEFWNSQNGKFEYLVVEADGSETIFDVVFELSIQPEATLMDTQESADIDPSGNSFKVVPDAGSGLNFGGTTEGEDVKVVNSRKGTDTGSHEVGHTMGLGHSGNGVMKEIDNAGTITRNQEVERGYVQGILDYAFDNDGKKPNRHKGDPKVTVSNPDNVPSSGSVRESK